MIPKAKRIIDCHLETAKTELLAGRLTAVTAQEADFELMAQ